MKYNISGIEYTTAEVDGLFNKYDRYGMIYFDKTLIEIDKGLSDDKKKQVTMHELLHAILVEAGYVDQSDMEDLVERVSIVLYQFVKYNDLSYFKEEVK